VICDGHRVIIFGFLPQIRGMVFAGATVGAAWRKSMCLIIISGVSGGGWR
jgi:hypothetical protein